MKNALLKPSVVFSLTMSLMFLGIISTASAKNIFPCDLPPGYPRMYCVVQNPEAKAQSDLLQKQGFNNFIDGEEEEVLLSRECTATECVGEFFEQAKLVSMSDFSRQKAKKYVLTLVRETFPLGPKTNVSNQIKPRRKIESVFITQDEVASELQKAKSALASTAVSFGQTILGTEERQGYNVAWLMSLVADNFISARVGLEAQGLTAVIPKGVGGTSGIQINLTKNCVDDSQKDPLDKNRVFYDCQADYLVVQAMANPQNLKESSLQMIPVIVDLHQRVDDQGKNGYYVTNEAKGVYVLTPQVWQALLKVWRGN